MKNEFNFQPSSFTLHESVNDSVGEGDVRHMNLYAIQGLSSIEEYLGSGDDDIRTVGF